MVVDIHPALAALIFTFATALVWRLVARKDPS